MPFSKRLFQQLCNLDSFVVPSDLQKFPNRLLRKNDDVFGVYFNTPDNFLIFSSNELHWVHSNLIQSMKFNSIKRLDLLEDSENFEIQLTNHDNSTVVIPICNETEQYPDIFVVHEYLMSILFWPHQSWNPEDIKDIQSKSDLYFFLENQEEGWSRHSVMLDAIRSDFPKPWQLEYFDIDPSIFDYPDVWRILALFLSTENQQDTDEYN